MSPDSPNPSARRRAWRMMAAAGCLIGSTALFVSVLLWDDIQESRTFVTYDNCQEQNQRNRNTIAQYDAQIEVAIKRGDLEGARLQRARESRAFTVALINTLAPQQDCRELVARRLGRGALEDLER